MLQDFLSHERSAIIAQCEERVVMFGGTLAKTVPPDGWKIYYDDLIEILIKGKVKGLTAELGPVNGLASKHIRQYVHLGYSVADVIRSYEILSNSIGELAEQVMYAITPGEHRQLDLLVSAAITEALTEYENVKLEDKNDLETRRLGFLAHELRNGLQAVVAAFSLIESGSIGTNTNTSNLLQQSLARMTSLIDGALTEVRLRAEVEAKLQPLSIADLLNEVMITSSYQARKKSISIQLKDFEGAVVHVDKQLGISALSNLIQNAIKYSYEGSTVQITSRIDHHQAFIDVQDECGGLPANIQQLLTPFSQHSHDRSGLGLGLSIALRATERCGGTLSAKDIPGIGCIFTMELPLAHSHLIANA